WVHFSVNFCFSEAADGVVVKSQLNFQAGKVEIFIKSCFLFISIVTAKCYRSLIDKLKLCESFEKKNN
ncbi:hypothetical protein, partial [Acetobacterium fimetarium]|uniref:hypothetical protein n=1 Tax=Acetobacterium fimetarium TaxID=52691 RepID=UPI001A9AFD8B